MKYVYVVMYAYKENGGFTLGYANIEISSEIDCYEYLERIADKIAEENKVDKGTKVVILNYVLLRTEEGERC